MTTTRSGTTREDILSSAADLIDARGFDGFSISDLTAASGVSNGSIYHHFGSKDAVLVELLVRAIGRYQDELLAVLDVHPTDAEAGVRSVVSFHLGWAEKHRSDAQLLLDHRDTANSPAARAVLQKLNRRFLAATSAWLDQRTQAGHLGPVDIETAHAIVFAPAQELTRLWLRGRLRGNPSDYAGALGAAAWAGLIAGGSATE